MVVALVDVAVEDTKSVEVGVEVTKTVVKDMIGVWEKVFVELGIVDVVDVLVKDEVPVVSVENELDEVEVEVDRLEVIVKVDVEVDVEVAELLEMSVEGAVAEEVGVEKVPSVTNVVLEARVVEEARLAASLCVGVLLFKGQITCGAIPGPLVIGLHPGRLLRDPCTGSFPTEGDSGQLLATSILLLAARAEQAEITPPLSVYRHCWTAAVCTS